jgi:glutamyl-tRNA reductase
VKAARRVSTETAIHQRRVSIPSIAVAEFARGIFEDFADKNILLIGAGEMGEETVRYLQEEGARRITVINRSPERARALAERCGGEAAPWEQLHSALVEADVVISTTGATEPVVTLDDYKRRVNPRRFQRPIFILDLAMPRDFDPAIDRDGDCLGVYLYSIDDLAAACDRNRKLRDKELPRALKIVEEEAEAFMADLYHRSTAPIIKSLRASWQEPKERELRRLLNKLPDLDERSQKEIEQAFDRLVNKLLHPPLESLRDEARNGTPHGLLDSLKRLFQIKD